jgi:hypothetical protein
LRAWFDTVLKLASKFALSDNPTAAEVQKVIAREFRGLWNNTGCAEEVDQLARSIAASSFWRDGWIAARQSRIYDGKRMDQALRERLTELEEFLRPKDLVSRVRGSIIGVGNGNLDLEDLDDDDGDESDATQAYAARAARSAAAIRVLGHDVAADGETFNAVLSELLGGNARALPFGEALAEAAENPRGMWDKIVGQFAATENAGLQLLGGFISGLQKRDAALADAILDEVLEHSALAAWFPILQTSVQIDDHALGRLHRALELGKAQITSYYSLAYGRVLDQVPGPEFRDLVLAIARRSGGCPVGLQIVTMRLHTDRSDKREPLPEVREAGLLLLAAFEFHGKDNRTMREDRELGIVVRASLAGEEGVPVSKALCRKLMVAAENYDASGYDYDDLVKGLLAVQPLAVLDELFSGDLKSQRASTRLLNDLLRFHKNVLDALPDDIVISWCDRDPMVRYPLAASVVLLFRRPKDGEPHEWTPIATKLLEKAPDPRRVLNETVNRLHPSSWSGSLATKLEGRLKLLNTLPGADSPALIAPAADAKSKLQAYIDAERAREREQDRARNNRFE